MKIGPKPPSMKVRSERPRGTRDAPLAKDPAKYVAPSDVPSAHVMMDRKGSEPVAVGLVELRTRADDDTLDMIFQKHLIDFRTAFAEMRKQAPSVVFFGGARLKPRDKYYQLAQAFGAALARARIPPKTGAGLGAMHAVPAQFIAVRDVMEQSGPMDLVTYANSADDVMRALTPAEA
jgi:hypothetical protein